MGPEYTRTLVAWVSRVLALALWSLGVLASTACAEVCPNEQLRIESNSAQLPNCRAYELVSPIEKNANAAGANEVGALYSYTRGDGGAVLYGGGADGETPSGVDEFSVARRSARWNVSAALPAGAGGPGLGGGAYAPDAVFPSADLSHIVFAALGSFTMENPVTERTSGSIYRIGEDPFLEPEWLGRPTITTPDPPLGGVSENVPPLVPAGGSANLSVVYFTYYGMLVPEDAPRAENVKQTVDEGKNTGTTWGFYEWKEGVLKSAGILPDGGVDPFGAVPAASSTGGASSPTTDEFNNQVSANGSRALFVSPDPRSAHRLGDPVELYVRENGSRTVLVSRNVLNNGTPAQGYEVEGNTTGVSPVSNPGFTCGHQGTCPVYAYASADGTKVFFESDDRLTVEAPDSALPKEYVFNVNTETLGYLPAVTGTASVAGLGASFADTAPILASTEDGSRVLFEKREGEAQSALDLWTSSPHGGSVTKVTELPPPENTDVLSETGHQERNEGNLFLEPARSALGGEVFVFETDSPIPGAKNAEGTGPANNRGSFNQVYRYDTRTSEVRCVSCPPSGTVPSGNARLSEDDIQLTGQGESAGSPPGSRGVSTEGNRVFFDSPEALVPQAVNGKRDVYEWELGHVYLVSSGTSQHESFFLDNSETGDDVFFATTDGLVASDTDGAYDVYDAHVNGGLATPRTPMQCATDCQGPVASAPVLATPGTASWAGGGNLASSPAGSPVAKPSTLARRLAGALRACRAKRKRHARVACERQARKRYAGPNSHGKAK